MGVKTSVSDHPVFEVLVMSRDKRGDLRRKVDAGVATLGIVDGRWAKC